MYLQHNKKKSMGVVLFCPGHARHTHTKINPSAIDRGSLDGEERYFEQRLPTEVPSSDCLIDDWHDATEHTPRANVSCRINPDGMNVNNEDKRANFAAHNCGIMSCLTCKLVRLPVWTLPHVHCYVCQSHWCLAEIRNPWPGFTRRLWARWQHGLWFSGIRECDDSDKQRQ